MNVSPCSSRERRDRRDIYEKKQGHSTVRADELVLFFSDRTSVDTGLIADSVSGVERTGRCKVCYWGGGIQHMTHPVVLMICRNPNEN